MSSTDTITPTDLTGTYNIDPAHSRLGFVARHAMVTKVRGSFKEFEGTLSLDAADPTKSSGTVVIQAKSIDTGNADRDGHLKGNDFFSMDEFPEIRFVSTAVEPVGGSDYKVTGDLTIRGVTKSVTIDVEYTGAVKDPFGNQRLGLEGKATINRKDWGINFNAPLEAGGLLVSEKITIEIDISAIKAS